MQTENRIIKNSNNNYTYNTNEKIFNVQKYLYIVDSQVDDNLSSATCLLYKCSRVGYIGSWLSFLVFSI